MADGQNTVTGGSYFDQINASLNQYREKKQRSPAPPKPAAQGLTPPPATARQSTQKSPFMAVPNPQGLAEQGNLSIWDRPTVQNADGSHSSEYSISNRDPKTGYEVLVPTVVNGKFLTPDGKKPPKGSPEEKSMFGMAWQHYQQTGENLGKFHTPQDADSYAEALHSRGEQQQPQQKAFSFDSLTQDLTQRRQQKGDKEPVLAAQPQLPSGQEVLKTVDKVNAWTDRQGERLGTWAASKLTLSPEQVKQQLDKVPSNVFKAMHYAWDISADRAVTPYDETDTRRTAQKLGVVSQKVEAETIKGAAKFITSPQNVAFMLSSEFAAPVRLGVDMFFGASMTLGAIDGVHKAFKAGDAANWDVFSTSSKDGVHFEYKPEAAAFWQAVGDTAVSTFFARIGVKGAGKQADYLHTFGQFNKAAQQLFGKPWVSLSEDQKAITTAVVQANHAKGIDGIRQYAEQAKKFGLQDPTARVDTSKLLTDWNEQLTRHRQSLREADLLIDNAPEKVHRGEEWVATPELPPDESQSEASREALRKLQMGEELTSEEKEIGRREESREKILLNLSPEQTAGLSDRDFRRWSRRYATEDIVDGDDLLNSLKSLIVRGDLDAAKNLLSKGVRWSVDDPLEIPDDVAKTLREKRELAARNKERNEVLARKIKEAEKLLKKAQIAKNYDLEPLPVLGEASTEKKSKIWTPEGEKEITIFEPSAAQAGNRDLAVLNPQDREFARQKQREDYAHSVIEQERQRRQQEYARKAQQFQDQIKREAEKRQQAEEAGLKVEERRPVRYMTDDEIRRMGLGDAEKAMTGQMEEIANRNMFVNPDQMLRHLRRPQRDAAYSPEEQDFLRMAQERELLRHYQDPQNLAPVTRTGEPLGTKPSMDVVRERLADVTSPEQARDVLDGMTDEQLPKLMIPLNQAFAGTGTVYGSAGERPLFTDSRGDLHEGSSWQRHEGVDVLATVPVHPEDVPKWGIPGDDKRFILQIAREGDGVFGEDGYTEPQVVLGKVDPAAERRNWDWTDWAAHEQNRRDNALFEDLAAVDRQNDLENAAAVLGEQATHAATPEEADDLAKKSQEAEQQAKAIEQERLQEENKEQAKDIPVADFPEKAPVKEIASGRSTEVSLPSGRKLKAHYALVSLDDLIVSHLPMENFQANDDYTAKPLQPNDYASNEYRQDEVKYRASNPDFGQIFNTSSTGDQGPPTVRRDGIVAGGNGRLMSLEMLYASGRGNEVVNAIEQTKDQFGIDVPTPNFEDSPTIVRVLDEPLERKEEVIDVGQQMNVSTMTKRNAAEDAAATALRFTPDMMNWIVNAFDAMDDDASLRDFMRKYAVELADRYEKLGIISHNERGAFINDKGEINADAKLKFERAVRGAVIKDPVALAILEQPGMAAQSAALDRALPGLLRMVAKGGIWDVSDYLAPAIKRWESINDLRGKLQDEVKLAADHGQKGVTLVDAYLYPEQVKGTTRTLGDFTERPRVDKITESIMRLMEKKSKDIKESFNAYSLDAEGLQATLTAPPEPWESFETHIGSKVGVEVDQSDWGRTEAIPEAREVSQAPVPPVAPAVLEPLPEPNAPQSLEAPPSPPVAVTPETGGTTPVPPDLAVPFGEDALRAELEKHSGISPAQREGMIQVWKAFAEKYQGVPFDQWVREKWSGLKTGGEYKGEEGLQQSDRGGVTWAYHPQKGILTDRAGRRSHDQLLREAGVDRMVGRAFDEMPRGRATVDTYGRQLVLTVPESVDVTPQAERELRRSLDVPDGYQTRVVYGSENRLFQDGEKVVRGMTQFAEDGTAIMHLFEKANFSTFAHESFHIMRRYLKPEDTAVLEKALKVKDGAWTTAAEEKAARSWEKYLRDGTAPNAELKTLFAKIASWMKAIYQQIKGGPLEGVKVSDEVKAVFDRMLTGEKGPEKLEEPPKSEPPVQDLDKPPLSPEDRSADRLLQLLQEDTTTDRDKKIKFIQDRLKGAMHPDVRKKFEGLLAQLQGDAKLPEKLAAPPEPPKTAPKAAAEPLTPAPKKTIKIWTPSGEIEVAREETPSGEKPSADTGRTAVNGVDRDKGTRPPEPLSERPGLTARGDKEPTPVRPVPAGKRAGGKGSEPRPDRQTLPDVQPTRVDAPKRERGEPLYSPEEWEKKRSTYGLPQGMPAPYVKLDSDLARLLIFPGQKEVAESVLSGLDQHDAYILASTTGTGKTYLASAVLSQIMRREKPKNVLILTKSQNLVRDFKNVALDFDVEVKRLPDGEDTPSEPGVYATTYATGVMRTGLRDYPWDFVITDEIAEARRWYDSKQGMMTKDLTEKSGKVLYMSATPFHTALELGHMTKLGLWNTEGFDQWGKQFGIYRDKEGNYGGGNAPKKLVKLRQQLIERGQYANIDRNMDGYNPNFLLAPLSEESKTGLRNIVEAFDLAKDYYARKGQLGKMRALQGNMVVYMKSYLERQRLPEAIELAKRAEREGYKAIIFSEHKAGREDLFKLLEEPDAYWGGKISQIFPRIPDVVDELQKAFPGNLANFSGKESVMRAEEKDAFLANEKRHIFATYGAGGVGVSLHDTNGKYPRVAIYLGPPYSGVMLDQAIGRPWRYGTKSNVQAYFLLSNARDEVDLVIKKVGPRLESLRALVSGIDMTDPMTMAMRKLESAQDGALAYDLGQEHTTDKDGLTTTYDHVPIVNWREAPMPPASEAMNKGMRFPGEGPSPHPGIERMMQADEYEPPKDLVLPDSVEARLANEQTAEDFANGVGAPGMTAEDLEGIPHPERVGIAEAGQALALSSEGQDGNPVDTRRTWEETAATVKAGKNISDAPPLEPPLPPGVDEPPPPVPPDQPSPSALRLLNWMAATQGREVMRRAGKRGGNAQAGIDLAAMPAEYQILQGNIAGPRNQAWHDFQKKHKLSHEEFENMVLYHEGVTRKVAGQKVPVAPLNDRVVAAEKDLEHILGENFDILGKAGVYTKHYDMGKPVDVPFANQNRDPHYWPHFYDYNRKVVLEDQETGEKKPYTVREILNGKKLGDAKYQSIVRGVMQDTGLSRPEVEDAIARHGRDVPLAGSIERSRDVGLPYYETGPEVIDRYHDQMGEVIARTKVFGQEGQKLRLKLNEVPSQRDRNLIENIMNQLLKPYQRDPDLRALMTNASDFTIVSKMLLSPLKVPFHGALGALHIETHNMVKGLFALATDWSEWRRISRDAGLISKQRDARFMEQVGVMGGAGRKFLRWNGFTTMYDVSRMWNGAGAKFFMDDALKGLIKNARHERFRRELNTNFRIGDDAIDQAISNRRWTKEDYARGMKSMSDIIMLTGDPTEMPPWARAHAEDPIADSALGIAHMVYALKSFEFNATRIVKERVIKEVFQHRNFRPLMPFLLAMGSGEILRQIAAISHGSTAQLQWWDDPKNQNVVSIVERLAGNIGRQYAWQAQQYLLGASGYDAGWGFAEATMGPFFSSLIGSPARLYFELKAAGSDYGRYNALKRWANSEVVVAAPIIKGVEWAVGYDAAAAKKKADKERGQRSAQTRHERKHGHAKPL